MSGSLLTTEQVADFMQVGPAFVRRLLKTGDLIADAAGMIRKDVLDLYIDSCRADTCVYFIQMETSRHVKIGIAAEPEWRLKELRTGNPEKLTIIAFTVVVNARSLERQLHKALADYRLEGEWFRAGPWLDALLAARKKHPGMSENAVRRALLP